MFESFYQEHISHLEDKHTAYHVGQELILKWNQRLVQVVHLEKFHSLEQNHALHVRLESLSSLQTAAFHVLLVSFRPQDQNVVRHVLLERSQVKERHRVLHVLLVSTAILIIPSAFSVARERFHPNQALHLVLLVLPEVSQILEQHHALRVQLGSTGTRIKSVAWIVPREHFPQITDQKLANNAHEVPIHHLDQLDVQSALQEATPVVKNIPHVPNVKLDLILLILGPHLVLPVMREEHPLWDPQDQHLVHHALKAFMLFNLDQA